MVELLVALAVVAVGVLGVFAALSYGMRGIKHGARMTEAVTLSRQLLERIRAENLAFDDPSELRDPAAVRRPINDPPFTDLPASEFRRNIFVRRMSNDATSHENRLMRIRVTVYWQEQGGEKHVQLEGVQRRI